MGGLIGTIVVGLIVGALARFVMPGKQPMGWIMTAVVGVGGSLLASYLGSFLGWYKQGEVAGWIASVVGAIILMVVAGKVLGGSGGGGDTKA
jgi:uncharacterized membrane protein YeaQ/YmgE (transglycosylase-associated protein family)